MNNQYTATNKEPTTSYPQEFWDNYTLFLIKQGVSKKYVQWSVLRTKQYIAAYPEQHIRTHTEQQVTQYLSKTLQQNRLKDWQIIQLIDAIRLLFVAALKAPWASDFDWDYWKDSIKTLENDHRTVARDYSEVVDSLDVFEGKPHKNSNKERYQQDLQKVTKVIRTKNYSMSTEKTYRHWIARFYYFHQPENVKDLTQHEVKQYLEYLVLKRHVSVATQKQALNAIAFLFHNVWEKPLGDLGKFTQSKRPRKLPVVLSREEVKQVLEQMSGIYHLMAGLMYGGGLRLMECVTLRIQDVDFQYNQLVIRNTKGFKETPTDQSQSGLNATERFKHPWFSPVSSRSGLLINLRSNQGS